MSQEDRPTDPAPAPYPDDELPSLSRSSLPGEDPVSYLIRRRLDGFQEQINGWRATVQTNTNAVLELVHQVAALTEAVRDLKQSSDGSEARIRRLERHLPQNGDGAD